MSKLATHKSLINIFTLGFKKVKHSLILGIAILVSVLVNLPRALSLFDLVEKLSDSFSSASINDIIFRLLILALYSWVILQYNTNWKHKFSEFNKSLRIVISVVVNAFLFFGTVKCFLWFNEIINGVDLIDGEIGLLYFVYFIVLLILVFISNILRYQIIHRDDILEKERLKQQSTLNELEALKNQINPHFLFNSLNSLNSLLRDNKPATTFVNKLSFMYRYILQSGSQDLVTIEEELKFLESYTYLIKARYRERFSIEVLLDNNILSKNIPALALQLLVENAVKHNEISESHPLLVKVYNTEEFLIVENVIRPRTTFVDSTGNGLINLKKRYELLNYRSVIITNTENRFKVKLPLK